MLRLLRDPANMLTASGLVLGSIAVAIASAGAPSMACALLLTAILIDQIDGPVARRIKNRASEAGAFGKELDSLTDVVTLAVAPMVLTVQISGATLLAFVAGGALCLTAILRIAAFNVVGSLTERYGGLPLLYTAPLLGLFLIAEGCFQGLPAEAVIGLAALIAAMQWSPFIRIRMLHGWMYPVIFVLFTLLIVGLLFVAAGCNSQ